ncbi:hypothetical protein FA13DRAFT_99819 [Coprinellus micaceus]|uniref:Uncharacterized protein n=1 Tax=Coprinellus micaceus TaxID=71717 RepID=A0A4Y7SI27_COPMI|nr:hypothetical protein FA13DRAFT_99819 [Coprinellus micaceus]
MTTRSGPLRTARFASTSSTFYARCRPSSSPSRRRRPHAPSSGGNASHPLDNPPALVIDLEPRLHALHSPRTSTLRVPISPDATSPRSRHPVPARSPRTGCSRRSMSRGPVQRRRCGHRRPATLERSLSKRLPAWTSTMHARIFPRSTPPPQSHPWTTPAFAPASYLDLLKLYLRLQARSQLFTTRARSK